MLVAGHILCGSSPFTSFEHPDDPLFVFDTETYHWHELAVTSASRKLLERSNFGLCQTEDMKKIFIGKDPLNPIQLVKDELILFQLEEQEK